MGGGASTPAAAPSTPPAGGSSSAAADRPDSPTVTPPMRAYTRGGAGAGLAASGSSLGSIVPTIFVWSDGGQEVFVTGAWDRWAQKVPMAREAGGREFSTVISLPVGRYQYKFVVDGNWRHRAGPDTETDMHGNLNNTVTVNPHYPEYDSNLALGAGGPPSPVDSYDFSMPASEDYSVEPMALPPLFRGLCPDGGRAGNAANPSCWVALGHTYGVAGRGEVRTLAIVTRYKRETLDRYITTVIVGSVEEVRVSSPIAIPGAADEVEPDRGMAMPGRQPAAHNLLGTAAGVAGATY